MKEYLVLFLIVSTALLMEMQYKTIKIGEVIISTRKISFGIIFIYILFLGVFKGENYGYDAEGYRIFYFDFFKNVSIMDALKSGIEPGFAILSFIICKITTQYWVYRSIIFVMIFCGMSFVIWEKSDNVALSYLIYISFGFLSFDFFILRQALATTIVFMGIFWLENKEYVKFIITVLLAASFHYTAALSLILLPLALNIFKEDRILKRCLYFCGAFIVGAFFLPLILRMYPLIDYSQYVVSGEGYGMLLVLLIFWIMFEFARKKYLNGKLEEDSLFEYGIGSIYIQIISIFFSLFNRTIYYALAYSLICIPNICEKLSLKTRKSFVMALWMIMLLMFYKTILCAGELIPYVWL